MSHTHTHTHHHPPSLTKPLQAPRALSENPVQQEEPIPILVDVSHAKHNQMDLSIKSVCVIVVCLVACFFGVG